MLQTNWMNITFITEELPIIGSSGVVSRFWTVFSAKKNRKEKIYQCYFGDQFYDY